MDSTMQLHPRTAADQTLEPVDLSHEPEAGNATSQEIGAEVCAQREKIVDIICYGIGSVESSRNSQFQIALALCLKDILRLSGTMSIFDPVMTEYDKQLAEKLGLHVLKANDQANQVLSARTLLYMPHCPKGLYSHVLEANWSRKHLDNMVILGNRFTMYDESPSFRQFAKQAPFILPALTIATVHGLPETKFEDNTVFNDLAFHCFPADKILPDVDVQGREVDPELL
ncbi:SRR1-domain-containing protein [Gamsiella multidivaricata]|uniref:SRR1-domain-containing protein n=1 Tax=Gamsiella multidivaricata TaxID=101098 RepID=UPI00222009F6|nr:SRR1-domain-containing protein [Gamsiella multidivaricata]KAI7816575.1 SRR1-domain-containing protein [Gamsiella multidivaricata]